jgi:hypothetical protein
VIDLIETNRLKRVVVKLFIKIGRIVVKSIKTSELRHCQRTTDVCPAQRAFASSNLCREGPPLVPLQAQTYAFSRRPPSSASHPFIGPI